MAVLEPVTRPRDIRRVASPFIENMTERMGRMSLRALRIKGLGLVTELHTRLYASGRGGAFRTYDAYAGVLVVSAHSDLPVYQAVAARILGRRVVTVYTDHQGTVYQAALTD